MKMGIYSYWGKAKKDPLIKGPDYHFLAYHSLDVAAVGFLLLAPEKPLCRALAAQLKVNPEWLQAWFTFCLMLHDLGKFCRAFQNLAPNLAPCLVPYDARCCYSERHDTLGFMLWQKVLSQRVQTIVPASYARTVAKWLEIVCGHHGKPPKNLLSINSFLTEDDERAAEEFVREVAAHWLPDLIPLTTIDKSDFQCASWQLAGIAVLADWLGSNQEIFRYRDDVMALSDYWTEAALEQAPRAITQAQLGQRNITPFASIKQQFDFINAPTPLQAYAQTANLGASQQLFILEDVTGAGKTEAAMVLVHRLMASGLANGVYVGLPTMATANAMYERMSKSYRRLYAEHELPSLVLAHGASRLSDAFTQSVTLSNQVVDKSYDQNDLSASAYCNQWLADSRKKALLADVGVGTIDQALLAVLPARHQSLRLLGLTGKVLLVDEVHAFDPYMRSLLAALLRAHAAQGGSAILLSATLPFGFRKDLVAAFAQGSQGPEAIINKSAGYPWVSHYSCSGLIETPVATRKCVRRNVAVKRLDNEDQAIELIKKTIQSGQCICWIRNTVKGARHAYQQLQDQPWLAPEKLTLFHSRYAMVDRQGIEKDVLQRFGKESTATNRTGQVLIATQVVEQSLDLDFDVMISDLAPIDLLIQRGGRLQRHTRKADGTCLTDDDASDQRPPACLYVLSPDPAHTADKNWLRTLLPGTQAIYPNVGQLWLTIRGLLANDGFAMPEDARELIEGVYGDEAQSDIPLELDQATQEAIAEQRAQRGMGEFNQLELEKGYTLASARQSGGWDEDVRIPTRLGGDTVTVVLLQQKNGRWAPYTEDSQHQWALSQINLPKAEWQKASQLIPTGLKASLEQLKEDTPALRWVELMPLIDITSHLYDAKDGWLGG
jgi:CRISPR-associated endonuclease/helicase Cas3